MRRETIAAKQETKPHQAGQAQPMLKEDFILHCGACGEGTNAHRKGFDENDVGAKITCYTCKKPKRSKDWLCKCRKSWYLCDIHKYVGRLAREEEKRTQVTVRS